MLNFMFLNIDDWSRELRLMAGCALASKLFDIYSSMLLGACGCSFQDNGGDGCTLAFVVYLTVIGHLLCSIVESFGTPA